MADQLVMLEVSKLVPAKDNARRSIGDIAGLTASVKTHGILQPLIVRPHGKRFQIVAGARRHAAAKRAGLNKVPVLVRNHDDRARREIMLVENLQRADLTALEEAAALKELLDLGRSQKTIAARIGASQSHISKRLALLRLPEAAAKALDSGGITISDALELVRLADHPTQLAAALEDTQRHGNAKRAVEDGLRTIADDERIAAAAAELDRQKIPLVDYPPYGHWSTQTARPLTVGMDALGLDERKHRREPCHAATICRDRYSVYGHVGKIIWVCAEPQRHAAKGASPLKKPQPAKAASEHDKAERARRAALKKAQAVRVRRIGDLLARRLPKEPLVAHLINTWLRTAGYEVTRVTTQLLGIEPTPTQWDGSDSRNALVRHVDAHPEEILRVGFALACAYGETCLRGSYLNWDDARPHLLFLETHGYELSDVERQHIQPTPTASPQAS